MKALKIILLTTTISLVGCISWVFAKSPFNDMPKGDYAVDLSHASVVWKVSHLGLSDYVARFADFDANIQFDPSNLEKSVVTASINPMSIQTAYPNAEEKDFNMVLATEKGWFNAADYPSIDFRSTSIDMTGEKTAVMQGELTFLGVTKAVSLDVEFNGAMLRQPFSGKPTMGFSATTIIKRSDWGMSKYVPSIGDNVEVMIEGEFAKVDD
ncbi:YceI family protein [Glaciecola sp. MH2013]|uniref:YceI family protein n=1 Tax=Glaciecola sp. MH2013 TaxID=2785524 RepID=UPI00189D9369|nr:YceI family protein [Glaciecola sp. MH2013]MBF7073894.1 YceI family protein [Glaciecola sp. MH2013]